MTLNSSLRLENLRKLFPYPWPIIWLLIFCAVLIGAIFPNSVILAAIKVSGIFFCFLYAFLYFRADIFLWIALLVTFSADIILAVNNTAEIGILCFYIAQLLHAYRLNARRRRRYVTRYAIFSTIIISLSFLTNFIPPIFAIVPFYLAAMIANIDVSWRWQNRKKSNPRAYFATSGFMFFLCCDICTAVSFLSLNGLILPFFYGLANFLAWLFYYPSQVLISNSSSYDLQHPFQTKS